MSEATANWDKANWERWRDDVVRAVQEQFAELRHCEHDDFDWDAWRPLFDSGYSPLGAVREAMSSQARAANDASIEAVA